MKIAKQKVSDDLTLHAQQMAIARNNAVTADINHGTNYAIVRAQAADREMHKNAVMQGSSLSRRNLIMAKNAGGRVIVETSNDQRDKRTEAERLNVRESVQSQIQTRRRAQIAAPIHESLSTQERIALENGPIQRRNEVYTPNQEPDQRQNFATQNGFQKPQISQNPAQEARNRRKLEQKIREMARK